MLDKITNSNADDPITTKAGLRKGAKRWPVAFIGLGVIITVIWIGYVFWLILRALKFM